MVSRIGSGLVRTVVLALLSFVVGASSVAAQGELKKSNGAISFRDDSKTTFKMEPLNSGLCQSQGAPMLTFQSDGSVHFIANVRSTSAKDTWQAYVRYYNAANSFLGEIKWWQYTMDKANVWTPWRVDVNADPNVQKKFKDIRKAVVGYRC